MKLWMVRPAFLPDPLVLRQHQTLHALLNGVARRKPRRGITRYLRFGGFLAWMHHITVLEMRARGWDHLTPIGELWRRLPLDQRRFDYPVDPAAIRADIAIIGAKVRSGHFASMTGASRHLDLAGVQLLEGQRALVIAGRLPDGALVI